MANGPIRRSRPWARRWRVWTDAPALVSPALVAICRTLCHKPRPPVARLKGCRGGGEVLIKHARKSHAYSAAIAQCRRTPVAGSPEQESQMPKIKTKSGAKKRFKITAGGKVLYQQSRKRHGMIKRTKKQIRQLRGTNVLFKTDGDNIKKYFLPNG
jgi:large subunit ribosomal protein L35